MPILCIIITDDIEEELASCAEFYLDLSVLPRHLCIVVNRRNCCFWLTGSDDPLQQLRTEMRSNIFVLRTPDKVHSLGRIAGDGI